MRIRKFQLCGYLVKLWFLKVCDSILKVCGRLIKVCGSILQVCGSILKVKLTFSESIDMCKSLPEVSKTVPQETTAARKQSFGL